VSLRISTSLWWPLCTFSSSLNVRVRFSNRAAVSPPSTWSRLSSASRMGRYASVAADAVLAEVDALFPIQASSFPADNPALTCPSIRTTRIAKHLSPEFRHRPAVPAAAAHIRQAVHGLAEIHAALGDDLPGYELPPRSSLPALTQPGSHFYSARGMVGSRRASASRRSRPISTRSSQDCCASRVCPPRPSAGAASRRV